MGGTPGAILGQDGRTPLVGCDRELAALDALVRAGGPRVIHLSGVAGVGKSLLAATFVARARDARATVIATAGEPVVLNLIRVGAPSAPVAKGSRGTPPPAPPPADARRGVHSSTVPRSADLSQTALR
jgi:hypothetical protein